MTKHIALLWRDRNNWNTAIPCVAGHSREEAGTEAIEAAKKDAAENNLDWRNYGYVFLEADTK